MPHIKLCYSSIKWKTLKLYSYVSIEKNHSTNITVKIIALSDRKTNLRLDKTERNCLYSVGRGVLYFKIPYSVMSYI